jgi:hypothetical protein
MAILIAVFVVAAHTTNAESVRSKARYWVQSGAFKSAANAHARCELLVQRGYRFAVQRGVGAEGDALFFCRSSQAFVYRKAAMLARRLRMKEPHDAVLVLLRPSFVAPRATETGKGQEENDLEALSGKWCGDPAVYGTDPLQIWNVKRNKAILQLAEHRTLNGTSEVFQGTIERLPGNLIKLTSETSRFRSEIIYGLSSGGLRGVSYRQEMKENGSSITIVPDSLHRCQ